jgi:hypothetical protein
MYEFRSVYTRRSLIGAARRERTMPTTRGLSSKLLNLGVCACAKRAPIALHLSFRFS